MLEQSLYLRVLVDYMFYFRVYKFFIFCFHVQCIHDIFQDAVMVTHLHGYNKMHVYHIY